MRIRNTAANIPIILKVVLKLTTISLNPSFYDA
jgi:hypothetical protein